jgi:hypothetical protein
MPPLTATTFGGRSATPVVARRTRSPADKEPEDDEDHGRNPKFQDASKVVSIIFGGDEEFGSRRDQKLLLREILSIEPAVPR